MSQKNPAATTAVRELYAESFGELLDAYQLAGRMVRDHSENAAAFRSSYVTVLSLAAPGIRIVSTIDADVGLLATIYPARGRAATHADLEDWCRELNNQLAGRLKNKLLARGCDLMIGLPSLLKGRDITTILRGDVDMEQRRYTSDAGRIVLTLATQIAPTILLDTTASAQANILREGEISLF